MYLACLALPADMDEDALERLGPGLDGLHLGYYVSRTIEDDDTSPWLMRWIMEDAPDSSVCSLRLNIWAAMQNIPLPNLQTKDWAMELIPEDKDWLAESYRGFQPFVIGDFYVHGSHYDGDMPTGKIPLMIDAATAFGSGEHPTTAGCLQALCDLKDNGFCPTSVMDMGCGSGILIIAAAKLWPEARLTAIDIEEDSVEVTQRHETLNGLPAGRIFCAAGDGFHAPLAKENAPYDLMLANILAGPLKDMANDLSMTLAPKAQVILSGLLNEQADDVLQAYADQGLILSDHKQIGEWSTLRLQKI